MLESEKGILRELFKDQTESVIDFLDATGNLISMSVVTITVLIIFIPMRLCYYVTKWREANDREKA